jgi:catechol 2,3-dioxygenase-like lactoylglutathione lyase family enzyme
MTITLNHTIVPVRDPDATAKFLTSILGLPPHRKLAHFTIVDVGATSLDLMETKEPITPVHFAFLVNETEFDEIFGRIKAASMSYWGDPFRREPGEINHWDDGRGVYFADPDGHWLEILTRPYGSAGLAAKNDECGALAKIWFDGWQDAHARIVPAKLAHHRTLKSFQERMRAGLSETRTVGERGAPLGFAMLKNDELDQLYVAARARGSGLAGVLIADAERRVAACGARTIWLACAIGNDRAARFYEKSGWHRAGVVTSRLDTPDGVFALDVWRYEKNLV